jgi:hypothetical protein
MMRYRAIQIAAAVSRFQPLQPREREFVGWVITALENGKIPGPTWLNYVMYGKKDKHLHGRYSSIRRELFLMAGLKEPKAGGVWRWPDRTDV